MPDIRLFFRTIDYVTDYAVPIRVWQPYVHVELLASDGTLVSRHCLLDSGAPLSVLPNSLWQGRDLAVAMLGSQLTLSRTQMASPEALSWMGAPCDLGEATLFLLDPDSGIRTGPHRMIAKLVRHRFAGRQASLERIALLGEGFLVDNNMGLTKRSNSGVLTGHISVP